jgi:hypothetical protein
MPDRHLWTRHSTKSITFTGAAGAGAVGTVAVFTITGRVLIHAITAFCTVDVAGATGTLILGSTGDTDGFIAITTGTDIDADEWWQAAAPSSAVATLVDSVAGGATTSSRLKALAANIFITVATADITAGTIVFDVIYTPLTDGGRLF